MPEYLTPGVYLEETSFRSRSIEGVATSTFGMAGLTRYGPVPYVPTMPSWQPVVMVPQPDAGHQLHRVRARLRRPRRRRRPAPTPELPGVRGPRLLRQRRPPALRGPGLPVRASTPTARSTSRQLRRPRRSATRPSPPGGPAGRARPARRSASGSLRAQQERADRRGPTGLRRSGVAPGRGGRAVRRRRAPLPTATNATPGSGPQSCGSSTRADQRRSATATPPAPAWTRSPAAAMTAASHITLTVTVRWGDAARRLPGLELDRAHPRSIHKVLQAVDPADEFSLVWLDVGHGGDRRPGRAAGRAADPDHATPTVPDRRHRGSVLTPAMITGEPADPDDATEAATGLAALAEVEDIAIVSSPDAVRFDTEAERKTATDDLIAHCEALKAYRIGIVDPPKDSSISEVRRVPVPVRHHVRRPVLPLGGDRRPDGQGRPGRRPGRCCSCRRAGSPPASTPAATSTAACTRRRPTRWCSASPSSSPTSPTTGSRCSTPRASTRCASSRAGPTGSGARAR